MPRYLVVIDTPGIKQFVFGTDPLAEVRGASALLDRLNRQETGPLLTQSLERVGGMLERLVYANGGSAQALVEAPTVNGLREALADLACVYRTETGGEVRIAFGYGPYEGPALYHAAVRAAHEQLRLRREFDSACRAVDLIPFVRECDSASHLPAQSVQYRDEEVLLISEASRLKRREARPGGRPGRWSAWMGFLDSRGDWPDPDRSDELRPADTEAIGRRARRSGYVGLVYADGNAMGRLVQELDTPETCSAFSELVDSSLQESCYEALTQVCDHEVAVIRRQVSEGDVSEDLPADILLLGGDDLLVLLPADRALSFARIVSELFEERTRSKIAEAEPGMRRFFHDRRIVDRGLTISCGVALAKASYPFYLLLDLAEELLKSAKRRGSDAPDRDEKGYWAPSFVDFHLVTGSNSHDLDQVRSEDYLVGTDHPRTLRPIPSQSLVQFEQQIDRLRREGFPRSKLHDLHEAVLDTTWTRAERASREIFSRCKMPHRKALWDVFRDSGNDHCLEFPWCRLGEKTATVLADLIDAYDLFPEKARS